MTRSHRSIAIGAALVLFVGFLATQSILAPTAQGAAIASAQSGNWDSISTWVGGVVPGSGDDVTVATGITVTIPNGVSVSANTLTLSGSLQNNGSLTMASDISGSGTFTQGPASTLTTSGSIHSGFVATSGNNTVTFTGSGTTDLGSAATYEHLQIRGNGVRRILAATTVNESLTVDAGSTLLIGGVNVLIAAPATINGTVRFTSAAGTKTFSDNVTVNSGASWENIAGENVSLGGNLTIALGTAGGGGSVTMTGSGTTISVTGTSGTTPNLGNLTVTGSVTNLGSEVSVADLAGSGTFTNTGSLRISGEATITTLNATANGNNVSYVGGNQTVKATTYHNLQLLGNGDKTLPSSATTLNGYLRVVANARAIVVDDVSVGAELCLAGAALLSIPTGKTVTVGTNIEVGSATCGTPLTGTINNVGTLTATGGLSGSGTLSNNGTLNLGGSATITTLTATAAGNTVNYTGTGQTVKGTAYRTLGITGTTATLGGAASVSGTLNLTGGTLATGANTLAVGDATVNRTTGHVIGNLQKTVPTGASTVAFEVGTTGAYAPVTVAFGSVGTSNVLTVRSAAGEHPNIGTSTLDAGKSVNRYWTITNGGVAFDTATVTFTFVAGDLDAGVNTANLVAGKRDGTTWTTPTVGTRTATSTQATGITSFSDFALAEVVSTQNTTPEPEPDPPTPSPTPTPTPTPTAPPAGSRPAELPTVTLGTASSAQTSTTSATTIDNVTSTGVSAQVLVPPGALPAGSTVAVAPITNESALIAAAPPPAGTTVVAGFQINATAAGGAALTTDFASPVALTFTFPASIIAGSTSGSALALAFWNGAAWITIPATITRGSDNSVTVRASVTHFTVFSLLRTTRSSFSPEPAVRGVSLAVWGGGTLADLSGALTTGEAAWVFAGGEAIGYIAGAPAFVNVRFVSAYPSGLAAGAVVVIVR